jgi:ATPase
LEKTAEIIFLVRPDFVIFDEVRRTRDFEIFADVRLAGVGLLGVTHANSALEAIQRLIGKVDLGLVSQVLDTVIHVEKGQIAQVLELRMTVKPPSGMQEELARPVIEIVQFPDGRVTHEMFAFGSEIAVVPVGGKKGNSAPIFELAREQLAEKIRDSVGVKCGVRITSDRSAELYVPAGMVSVLIGKGGENVRALENELGGVKLQISSFQEMPSGVEVVEERGFQINDHMGRDDRDWKNSKKGRRRKRKR